METGKTLAAVELDPQDERVEVKWKLYLKT